MTTRADPIFSPHPPGVLFDALFTAMPETWFQVVWADRELGALTVISKMAGGSRYHSTIYLRHAGDGRSVVLVQVTLEAAGGWGVREPAVAAEVAGLVQEVLARIGPATPG